MSDPWGKYTQDPTAPPDQRDWRNAPWGDVAYQAAMRLVPTYTGDMAKGMRALAGGVGSMFTPPTPQQRATAAENNARLASVAHSTRLSDILDPGGMNSEQLHNAASGIGGYLQQRYLAPGALKQTLATDPGGALMDVQSLATIPEGGEGLAMRAPGMAGRIARGVVTGAKTFNRATNPVTLAGGALSKGSSAAQTWMRGGPALDASGAFTPAALSAVQSAFPNGELTPTELANPKFRAVLASAFQTKGINPATVKEAVLQYHDAPVPRSVVTQTKAPAPAAATRVQTEAAARQALGAKANAIAGAPSPDPSAVAAALDDAHARSLQDATDKYEALRSVPGSFGQSLPQGPLNADIGAQLDQRGLPSTPELLSRSKEAYPQANKAYDLVNDALINGNTRLGGEITAPEVLEVRRQLTGMQQAADGSDRQAVRAITDGLHTNLENAADWGWFRTPDGISDENVSGLLKDANAAYKQHFDTFDNNQGPAAAIKRAVGSMAGSDKAGLAASGEGQMAAQSGLTRKLMSPTDGPATYSLLSGALGDTTPLDDFVRQSVLRTDDGGNLVAKPGQLRSFLDGPMGDKVFSPEDQSEVRLLAAAQDVLDAKPLPSSTGFGSQMASKVLRAGVGAGLGAIGGNIAFPGLGGEAMGSIVGGLSEQGLEHMNALRQAASEGAGAPTAGAFLDAPRAAGDVISNVGRVAPLVGEMAPKPGPPPGPIIAPPEHFEAPTEPQSAPAPESAASPQAAPVDEWDKYTHDPTDDGRDGFAAGGAVDHDAVERLVDKLMADIKVAKSRAKEATKPLLKVPDAEIARALAVAQRNR